MLRFGVVDLMDVRVAGPSAFDDQIPVPPSKRTLSAAMKPYPAGRGAYTTPPAATDPPTFRTLSANAALDPTAVAATATSRDKTSPIRDSGSRQTSRPGAAWQDHAFDLRPWLCPAT